jgi:hypothetical protein
VAGFQRSDNLIRAYTLRCLLWVCGVPPPVTAHSWLSKTIPALYSHRVSSYLALVDAFLRRIYLDPYFRNFVSAFAHSRRRYFMDIRHIGRTPGLAGLSRRSLGLRCLSADFTGLSYPCISALQAHAGRSQWWPFGSLLRHLATRIISSPASLRPLCSCLLGS